MKKHVFLLMLLGFAIGLRAADRKHYTITPVAQCPKINGTCEEDLWQHCEVASDFIQTVPKTDAPSDYRSEIRMCYSQRALYVFARLYQPKALSSRQLTARDMLYNVHADIFAVYLDPYDDHQNGYVFKVSSTGVQHDERLSGGSESGDASWDAVWTSAVSATDEYWQVEMEIPFSAIRFSPQPDMKWGINFYRNIRRLNESSYWNPIDVQKQGFLAQTGELNGFKGLHPPVRLFLYPYLSTGLSRQEESNVVTHRWLKSGGADIKYGLSESFTLDATLIPDFSQVISDNLIRNLSPFEQMLSENRPFFTEGTELFNKAAIFYSRRIGHTPGGYNDVQNTYGDHSKYIIEKNPNVTTLYNALKISGRTSRKLGVGVFNAVGAPMFARVEDKATHEKIVIKTEPLTNYNMIVLDQALRGQSSLNFSNTHVSRQGEATDANVSSLIWTQFNRRETYAISLINKWSILHQARNSIGSAEGLVLSKTSGKFSFTFAADCLSPRFNKNDMGIQFEFNNSSQDLALRYYESKPKAAHLQLYRISFSQHLAENTQPFRFKYYQASGSYFLLFKNFWDITFSSETKPIAPIDFYQLGTYGKRLRLYPYLYNGVDGSSDSRKKLFWGFNAGYGTSAEVHTGYTFVSQSMRYRFSPKLDVTITGEMVRDNNNIGFAYYNDALLEPVVGRRDVRQYTAELNCKLNLGPNTNFTARFRHYNAFIHYLDFFLVDETGEWRTRPQPYQSGHDENFNLQNVDVFFNWIFKPGSRFVLSYKQWLNDAYLLNDQMENSYFNNLFRFVKVPHAYEVSARVILFLDYNQMKEKSKGPKPLG